MIRSWLARLSSWLECMFFHTDVDQGPVPHTYVCGECGRTWVEQ